MSDGNHLHVVFLFHRILWKGKLQYLFEKLSYRTNMHNLNLRFKGC